MRKAQAALAITTVLVLAIILVGAFWINDVRDNIKEGERKQFCLRSIESNEMSRMGPEVFAENIKCPPKNVKIDDKDNKLVLRKIANEHVECKDIYLGDKGRELFDGTGIFCAVCSIIELDTEDKISGYTDFISTNNVIGKKVLIIDYLQGKTSAERRFNEITEEEKLGTISDELDPSKEYATIFVYARGEGPVTDFLHNAEEYSGKIISGTGISSTGKAMVMMSLAANPLTWYIVGTGVEAYAAAKLYSYLFEQTQSAQWVADTFLMEYSSDTFDELGCEYLPVEQGNI